MIVKVEGGNIFGSTVITDDQWHHVAVTLDADSDISDAKLYVDGNEEEISSYVPFAVNTGDFFDVRIGHYDNVYDLYFDGLIDDVRIYDRVLTPAEIDELFRM